MVKRSKDYTGIYDLEDNDLAGNGLDINLFKQGTAPIKQDYGFICKCLFSNCCHVINYFSTLIYSYDIIPNKAYSLRLAQILF